ncbi:MAG: HAD family phosphatase [Anaerolineales bacterium]|nr:HAD family phosphatase [Anaerolineales bacterium]
MNYPEDKTGIRLVAIDLDGTLLDGNGKLPPRGSTLIKAAYGKGIHIIIATTRNYDDVQRICGTLKINDPIICSNGAYIYENPTGSVWRELRIPIHIAERICQLADENDWELSTSVGETTYFKQRPGQALGLLTENIEVVKRNKDAIVAKPHRILCWQPEAMEGIQRLCLDEFPGECRTEVYYKPTGEPHSLGVFAWNADKGSALEVVLSKMGISQYGVMAIGDNTNDLPMFEFAKYRVAMSNGTEEIKRNASIIAPSNREEGVAWVFENYVRQSTQ